MKRTCWKHCGETLALASVVLGLGVWARAQETKPPETKAQEAIEVEVQLAPKAPAEGQLRFTKPLAVPALAGGVAGGEFWIGVQLAPLDELALAQLKLKQGVSAAEVLPDSPALKAGVQKHDVLLKFAGVEIATPQDLVAAVEKNKEQEVELTVLRGGQPTVLKVKPIKRPQAGGTFELKVDPTSGEAVRLKTWLNRLGQGETGADPLNVYRFRPGVVLQERNFEYPKDLTIHVEKQGNEPAKIMVKQGEKSWNVTPDKLGDLPAEVRASVEHLLGSGGGWHRLLLDSHGKEFPYGSPKGTLALPQPVPPVMVPRHVEVRSFTPDNQGLEAVRKDLQDLLKKVEAMRAPKAEPPLEQMKREISELRKQIDELRKAEKK